MRPCTGRSCASFSAQCASSWMHDAGRAVPAGERDRRAARVLAVERLTRALARVAAAARRRGRAPGTAPPTRASRRPRRRTPRTGRDGAAGRRPPASRPGRRGCAGSRGVTGRRSLTLRYHVLSAVKHAGRGIRTAVTLGLLGLVLALGRVGCSGADSPAARSRPGLPPGARGPADRAARPLGRHDVRPGRTPARCRPVTSTCSSTAGRPATSPRCGATTVPAPLLAWAPQAVNELGQGMFTEFVPLAAAIARDDPKATVLGFSWIDDSATALSPFDAWKSEANTDLNGQRLAAALGQVLAPTFPGRGGRIHLIGHSHGAKVATVAAIALERPPAQLTLLDSPENVLAQLPGRREPPRGLPAAPVHRARAGRDLRRQLLLDHRRAVRHVPVAAVGASTSRSNPAQFGALSVERSHRSATSTR